jgi:FMN phosphatase YigB (HAD superfamily)
VELPLIYAGKRDLKSRALEKIGEVGLAARAEHRRAGPHSSVFVEYLYAAYYKISEEFSNNIPIRREAMYTFLCMTFEGNGRRFLFNHFIERFHLQITDLGRMLEILRTVRVPLNIYPDMLDILRRLVRSGKEVVIATNGNHQQQSNKLDQLNFGKLRDHITIYFTNKPHIEGVNTHKNSVMIGDSYIDKQFAKNLGIDFIRKM